MAVCDPMAGQGTNLFKYFGQKPGIKLEQPDLTQEAVVLSMAEPAEQGQQVEQRDSAEPPTKKSKPAAAATPAVTPKEKRVVKAACVPATEGMPVDQVLVAWSAYKRSFPAQNAEQTKEGPARKEKCSIELAVEIQGNIKEESRWFDLWVREGRSWKQAVAKETIRKETVESDNKRKAWLTKGQIHKLYEDSDVTSALVEEKSKNSELWRPHPEIPHCLAARQYLGGSGPILIVLLNCEW